MSRVRRRARRAGSRSSGYDRPGDEAPSPQVKRPGAASAMAATALGEQRRAAGEGRGDGHAELERGLPGGGQRERGEAVGAVHLGRPDVGVAEARRAGRTTTGARQRHAVEGDRDAGLGGAHVLVLGPAVVPQPDRCAASVGAAAEPPGPSWNSASSIVRALGLLLVSVARHGDALRRMPVLHPSRSRSRSPRPGRSACAPTRSRPRARAGRR